MPAITMQRPNRRVVARPPRRSRLRVLHVIADTEVGGAEAVLLKVASRIDPREFELRVASLFPLAEMGFRLQELGIPVTSLNLPRRWSAVPAALRGLAACVRSYRPHLVQTWMYHADLLGGLAARLSGNVPVVWSVHHASLDRHIDSRNTRLSAALCSRLSRSVPSKIAVVSEASRAVHLRAGYCAEKLRVIPNGFDVAQFRPDADARRQVRTELQLEDAAPIVGLIGRFHPHKDHQTFVRAAARVAAQSRQVRFVCAGAGVTWDNAQLAGWIEKRGLREQFRLLGPRGDVPRLTAALDVAVCCSRTEAFPSVVGEAMACQVPCVVTDVGDCRQIIGSTGVTVPAGSPEAVADGVLRLLSLAPIERVPLGRAARQRIVDHYTIDRTADRYAALWREVIERQPGSRRSPATSAAFRFETA